MRIGTEKSTYSVVKATARLGTKPQENNPSSFKRVGVFGQNTYFCAMKQQPTFAVLFDMDGVICDTNPYHAQAWKAFLLKYGIEATDAEFAEHMYGKSNSYILQYFFKRPFVGEEFERMEFEKELTFRQVYEPYVAPVAGLVEFITDLHQHQAPMGIGTSAPLENMDLILSKVPIRAYMGSLLASQHVSKHKPDPEVYLRSAQNLGVSTDQCVVFEDSVSGVMAAKNANMKVVGVLTTYQPHELPPCDAYVKDYQDITATDVMRLVTK
jgi:HAD superfamily hydrolase (TIGR01509 family)